MRLDDLVRYHGRERPTSIALRNPSETVTFAELLERTEAFADALTAAGVGPGDRYGVLAANCLEFFTCYLGAAMVGAVTVPLNQRLAPVEWPYILDDSGCRLVVARNELVAALDGVRGSLRTVERFVALGASQPGWQDWREWLATAPAREDDVAVRPEDPVVQMYTSGTTGKPKGTVLSHGSLVASITQLLVPLVEGSTGCTHLVMPLSHMGATNIGLLNLFAGGSVYVQETFDPAEVVRVLDEERVNRTTLVPAMIQAILGLVPDVAQREYRDLEVIGYGAAPMAPETLRRAMEVFHCEFFQGFGQTEASGSITYLTPADHRRALSDPSQVHLLTSAGRPALATEVRIVDDEGRACAPGEVGEIVARGPQLMSGYWQLPDETVRALREGWLHTGDAGTLDEEGYLYVKDRLKDMIVSGGENVYPAEVEHVLFEHDGVADAAVIGVPDDRWGETVKAFVVPREGATLDEAEIVAFCKARIGGFKVPTSVTFLPVLPRNASGKVLKTELRAPFWEGRDRRVG